MFCIMKDDAGVIRGLLEIPSEEWLPEGHELCTEEEYRQAEAVMNERLRGEEKEYIEGYISKHPDPDLERDEQILDLEYRLSLLELGVN